MSYNTKYQKANYATEVITFFSFFDALLYNLRVIKAILPQSPTSPGKRRSQNYIFWVVPHFSF